MLSLLLLAAAPALSVAEQTAIFTAAGLTKQEGRWGTSECLDMQSVSYEPGRIDTFRDLNGDGDRKSVV